MQDHETDEQALTPTILTLTLGDRKFEVCEQNMDKARKLAGLAGRIMDKTRLVYTPDGEGGYDVDTSASSAEGMALLPARAANLFCDNFASMKSHRAFIVNDPRVTNADLIREFFALVGYLADPFALKAEPGNSTEAPIPTGDQISTPPSRTTGE